MTATNHERLQIIADAPPVTGRAAAVSRAAVAIDEALTEGVPVSTLLGIFHSDDVAAKASQVGKARRVNMLRDIGGLVRGSAVAVKRRVI